VDRRILKIYPEFYIAYNIIEQLNKKCLRFKQLIKKNLLIFQILKKIKLIELIERDKNIIENKKTDNVSTRDKEKCWMKITKEFNNNCISVHRDVCSLKNCWDNLKKKHVNILLKFAVNFINYKIFIVG